MTHAGLPSVSVIVVVRDGAAYLGEALDSVLAQDPAPLEVLVVDGGSSDGSPEIARSRPGVAVHTQASRGIAAAYNEGVALARGDLVAFISHDDRWLPGKLRAQVEFLAAHPAADCCVTHVLHVLAAGHTAPPGFRPSLLERPVPGLIMECLVARRAVFDRVGPFDPTFAVAEDTDWFARARDAGAAPAVLPVVGVHKRVHGSNASLTRPDLNALLLRAVRASVARKQALGGAPVPTPAVADAATPGRAVAP